MGLLLEHQLVIENASIKCLDNCRQLAGLDRKQVARLCDEFMVERTVEQLQSEYPPL